jgi:competence protein ComEA
MLYRLNPSQKLAAWGVVGILLAFFGYVGSWYLHRPVPLVLEEKKLVPVADLSQVETREAPPPSSREAKVIHVYVSGAVHAPGVYQLTSKNLVKDALELAGGSLQEADLSKLNLAAKLKDGLHIQVPSRSVRDQESQGIHQDVQGPQDKGYQALSSEESPRASSKRKHCEPHSVDLNSATAEELQCIPGVGPSTAARIVEYRETHGCFRAVDELAVIGGIGAKKLERIKAYLRPITPQ